MQSILSFPALPPLKVPCCSELPLPTREVPPHSLTKPPPLSTPSHPSSNQESIMSECQAATLSPGPGSAVICTNGGMPGSFLAWGPCG